MRHASSDKDLAEYSGVGAVDVLLGVRQLQVREAVHREQDSSVLHDPLELADDRFPVMQLSNGFVLSGWMVAIVSRVEWGSLDSNLCI
jgi:hypothetical protein